MAKSFNFWTFLRSGLRRMWLRFPARSLCLQKARKPVTGKRHKWEVACEGCDRWFMMKDVQVDHIVPCGTLKGIDDVAGFVERLFCSEDGLRPMCKPCHQEVTNEERRLRRAKGGGNK